MVAQHNAPAPRGLKIALLVLLLVLLLMRFLFFLFHCIGTKPLSAYKSPIELKVRLNDDTTGIGIFMGLFSMAVAITDILLLLGGFCGWRVVVANDDEATDRLAKYRRRLYLAFHLIILIFTVIALGFVSRDISKVNLSGGSAPGFWGAICALDLFLIIFESIHLVLFGLVHFSFMRNLKIEGGIPMSMSRNSSSSSSAPASASQSETMVDHQNRMGPQQLELRIDD